MATMTSTRDRYARRQPPLFRSYWVMPAVTGLAVLIVAAGMLTETLVIATRINTTVVPIRSEVTDIRTHTDDIAQLTQVDTSAKGIKQSADPLSGQAATILSTVGTIDGTVAQIDNATGSISAHASAIDSTVNSISPHVLLIAQPVEGIAAELNTTVGILNSVLAAASGIKGDTGALMGQSLLPAVEAHAKSIDCRLPTSSDCANG